jgi:hypothetical protein
VEIVLLSPSQIHFTFPLYLRVGGEWERNGSSKNDVREGEKGEKKEMENYARQWGKKFTLNWNSIYRHALTKNSTTFENRKRDWVVSLIKGWTQNFKYFKN